MSPYDLPLPNSAGASGPVTLTLVPDNCFQISEAIELLISMLDRLDPDPDLEEPGDLEPNLGWPMGHGLVQLDRNICHDHEVEQENEHGGDIQDEPHDEETDCDLAGAHTDREFDDADYV